MFPLVYSNDRLFAPQFLAWEFVRSTKAPEIFLRRLLKKVYG